MSKVWEYYFLDEKWACNVIFSVDPSHGPGPHVRNRAHFKNTHKMGYLVLLLSAQPCSAKKGEPPT